MRMFVRKSFDSCHFSVILQQPDICNKNVISADKTRRVLKVLDHPNFARAGTLGELVYDFSLLRVIPSHQLIVHLKHGSCRILSEWGERVDSRSANTFVPLRLRQKIYCYLDFKEFCFFS